MQTNKKLSTEQIKPLFLPFFSNYDEIMLILTPVTGNLIADIWPFLMI
jgi:hypothetical protein